MKHFTLAVFSFMHVFFATAQCSSSEVAEGEMKHFAQLLNYDAYSVSSKNFDVHYYRCDWTVDPAVRYIAGHVAAYFTITASANTIAFDLNNALRVDSVLHRNNKISFTQTPDHALQINLPATLAAGVRDSVIIYYQGVPPSVGFGSFNLSSHSGTPVMWTLSEPYGARTWWPCKDVLTDKADSIDIVVHNPAAYISSSNGLPVFESVTGNTRHTHWKHRYPIVTYLIAIAITNYNIDTDAVQLPGRTMPVVMYSYPENAATFRTATSIAKLLLPHYSTLFTQYPFAQERYAQTQFGWGGGMEHQTNSFIVSPNSGLVAHELAHQWFGNKITCGTWQDLWLNEGFATYLEYVYTELANPSAKQAQLQSWINQITSLPGGSVFVPDTTNLNRLFDSRLTYRKGGYLLHMLRWILGDDAFFKGVRRYITDPALVYRHAFTADLKRNLEAESGQDLTEFFNDWYKGEGYPNYTAAWSQQPDYFARIQLHQTPSHPSVPFFEMPVPIQFRSSTRDTVIRVHHTKNGEIFMVNPGFIADTVIIDPQLWILSKEKVARKSPTPVGIDQITVYPNPVRGILTFAFPADLLQYVRINFYNAMGQLIHSRSVPSTTPYYYNTDGLAAGVYWISITAKGVTDVKKILVTR